MYNMTKKTFIDLINEKLEKELQFDIDDISDLFYLCITNNCNTEKEYMNEINEYVNNAILMQNDADYKM